MMQPSTAPILIRRYEPDPARCVEALMRFLGMPGKACVATSPPATSPVTDAGGARSVKQVRRRATSRRGKKVRHDP